MSSLLLRVEGSGFIAFSRAGLHADFLSWGLCYGFFLGRDHIYFLRERIQILFLCLQRWGIRGDASV